MYAAQDGHLDCVGRLIDANAALEMQNKVSCWLDRTGPYYFEGAILVLRRMAGAR